MIVRIALFALVLGFASSAGASDQGVTCEDGQPVDRKDKRAAPRMCAVWTGSGARSGARGTAVIRGGVRPSGGGGIGGLR
jgi:hypothetical protein